MGVFWARHGHFADWARRCSSRIWISRWALLHCPICSDWKLDLIEASGVSLEYPRCLTQSGEFSKRSP